MLNLSLYNKELCHHLHLLKWTWEMFVHPIKYLYHAKLYVLETIIHLESFQIAALCFDTRCFVCICLGKHQHLVVEIDYESVFWKLVKRYLHCLNKIPFTWTFNTFMEAGRNFSLGISLQWIAYWDDNLPTEFHVLSRHGTTVYRERLNEQHGCNTLLWLW